MHVFVRGGKLIGRNFYTDDIDFDLTPVSVDRVLFRSGMLEFVPAAAGVPKRWQVLDGNGQQVAALKSGAFTPSTEYLRSLAGEYRSPELDVTYALTVRDSELVIQPLGRAEIPVQPFAQDIFAGSSVGVVTFLRDARGAVAGFTVSRDNARRVRFDRLNRAG